ILPLRWYMQILFDQAARGTPVSSSAIPFAILAALAVLYGGLAWLRLAALAARTSRAGRVAEPAIARFGTGGGLGGIPLGAIRRIFADKSVMGLMFIAPLLYGVFYPQPYLGQTLRHIPIAIVDNDRTELSRQIIMTLDADEAVCVAVRADTLADARQKLFDRRGFWGFGKPPGAAPRVVKGGDAPAPPPRGLCLFLFFLRFALGVVVGRH